MSDEAMHSWLYGVPSVNLRKGAPSAGGPARTWNSQATDERKSQFAFDGNNCMKIIEKENEFVVFKPFLSFFLKLHNYYW